MEDDIRLSRHFFLHEFLQSKHAPDLAAAMVPTPFEIYKMRLVCEFLLEPIRNEFKSPLIVTSGFRSKALNDSLIGSSATSQHMYGEAVDFVANNAKLVEIFRSILSARVRPHQAILYVTTAGDPRFIHVAIPPEVVKKPAVSFVRVGHRFLDVKASTLDTVLASACEKA